jgi:hypothetical protein
LFNNSARRNQEGSSRASRRSAQKEPSGWPTLLPRTKKVGAGQPAVVGTCCLRRNPNFHPPDKRRKKIGKEKVKFWMLYQRLTSTSLGGGKVLERALAARHSSRAMTYLQPHLQICHLPSSVFSVDSCSEPYRSVPIRVDPWLKPLD